ncbi:D-glycerate dehydrogenase [Candidatus Roizmanbacteria bacterium RIFCSPLOWO2_02_FULL_38_10]|uniref:Glyoxylate/hydroxypyruvate reductase B n=1 Tax=Candidatus Roizmanbacteria bacterium RIFCSPLOWO2_02_FULL_38_10 TaxID=1802074 RepID=A0A1F7JMM5_9BACT|nr:MAG: D-glycerate dehydrogenase [Candidatus Roizmanbacteria bacterium RIFCSPLOWO2_02_FULL_38_10]
MANIYVTRKIPNDGLLMIKRKFGKFDINPENRVLSKNELLKNVRHRDGVLCLLTDQIDREIIDAMGDSCKIISNYAVGFNNIDVDYASKKKIMVTNTPGVLTDATSDLAISLLFSCARRIVESDRFTRDGKYKGWDPNLMLGQEVTGKTLGIIGAGRIGSVVAEKMAKGFNMNVLYDDPQDNTYLEKKIKAKRVDLKTLLKSSDFVSVHINLTSGNRHLLSTNEFKLMKETAVLINTSRGEVIDEQALVKALQEKRIFAVGLDVYENEPKLSPGLSKLNNVVIVPHIGSATVLARTLMATMAAENLINGLSGKMPKYCVNKDAL